MKTKIDLSGKRAVITGAAGGLGRAFAVGLARCGARVVLADIDADGAAASAAEIDPIAKSSGVDVTDRQSCSALAEMVQRELGGLDILVNNAAVYGTLNRAPFESLEDDEWDRVLCVNVKGVWQMTRAMSPMLRASGSGSVINIGSATVLSGSPHWMHYVASKGAVTAMTRVMAREMGNDGVRANVIAPGFTLTDASRDLIEDATSYGAAQAALQRNANLDDILGGVLYLASDLSQYTTGQTLVIDGGKRFL